MATVQDVLNLARQQLGVAENPLGSNSGTPYHAWYGSESEGWQWCAIFVDWVFWHVDKTLIHGLKSAYSGDYLTVGRRNCEEVAAPVPGAIAIMDYGDGGITDHIGIVESVSGGNMTLIEGNHNNRVERVTRAIHGSTRFWYILPRYKAPTKKEQEDDDVYVASIGHAAYIPSMTQKGMKCYIDVTPQGVESEVRYFFRRDNGDYPKPEQAIRRLVKVDCTDRFEVGSLWNIPEIGGVTVKVEVLSGGPVICTRKQTL